MAKSSEFIRKVRLLPDYYKEKGFLELCKVISARLIARGKFEIFEGDISRPVEEEQAKIPINIRILSKNEDDIDRLVQFWPTTDFNPAKGIPPFSSPQSIKELIINRLSAGEECMIAEYAGKIVFMNWLGFQNTHLFNPYVRKRGIGADEALSYNTYSAVEYRGNHIWGAVFPEMFKFLKRKDYKKLIGYVLPDNYASMKVVTKFCGKPVQTLTILSCLGLVSVYFLSRRHR